MVIGFAFLVLLLNRQVFFVSSVEDMKWIDGKCACSFLAPLDWVREDESGIYDTFRPLPGSPEDIIELGMGETFFTIGRDERNKETILLVYENTNKDYPEMRTSFLLIGGEPAVRYDYYSPDKTVLWRSEFYIFPHGNQIVNIITDFPELSKVQAMLFSLRFE